MRPTLRAPPGVQSSAARRPVRARFDYSLDGVAWTQVFQVGAANANAERIDGNGTVMEAGAAAFEELTR